MLQFIEPFYCRSETDVFFFIPYFLYVIPPSFLDVCFHCLYDFHVVVRLPGMRAESVAVREIAVPQIPDTERNSQTLLGERR